MQVIQHPHLQGIVAHGDESILRLHEVDADEARFLAGHARLDGLKAQQRLGEDLLRRRAAQNLVDVPNLHLAGGRGLRSFTLLDLASPGFG